MSPDERQRMEQEPLWSPAGQVHWLLSRVPDTAPLLPVYLISTRLKIQQPVVAEALRALVVQGRAVADVRCELWGTPERAKRWLAAREERTREPIPAE